MFTHICRICGESFVAVQKKRIYCSQKCVGRMTSIRLTGIKQAPETVEKRTSQLRGPDNPNWKGGRFVNGDGYVLVWMPSHPKADAKGYMREHRLIMEKQIGRPLMGDEHVHHINGIKHDNRPKNLQVMGHGAHVVHHNTLTTHCKRGHKRTPSNTYFNPRGVRFCRACLRINANEGYHRRKALKT